MPRRNTRNQTSQVEASSRRESSQSSELEWGGFVNLKLTEDEKVDFVGWIDGDGAKFWADLVDIISSGFKYGVSWDGENSCFVATLTGQGVVGDERRFCLTARGGTMEKATALLVYKDSVMLSSDWGRYKPSTGHAEVE
jgi:hypothetical protein